MMAEERNGMVFYVPKSDVQDRAERNDGQQQSGQLPASGEFCAELCDAWVDAADACAGCACFGAFRGAGVLLCAAGGDVLWGAVGCGWR